MPSYARRRAGLVLAAVAAASVALHAAPRSPKEDYEATLGREQLLRKELDPAPSTTGASALLLRRVRTLVAEYEAIARRYPRSGYSDNALFQAALLSADVFWRFGEDADRTTALRFFAALGARYPSSSLNRQVGAHTARLEAAAEPVVAPVEERPLLTAIRRETLPGALRVTLELEREVRFHEERLDGPPRVFVDLQRVRVVDALKDATIPFADDIVRQIRVGRQQDATRVVLDLQGAGRHSVYTLYNPYRVVIDFERPAPAAPVTPGDPGAAWGPSPPRETAIPPAAPAANTEGGFSLSRQLGLGISRVVIDPGHGGHDPGARVKGLNEADLVLDVAQRLEKLLAAQPGVEVVLTRRANVYVPLEERTAIANRSGADLFLSIHANASRNPQARGIETYFLNFAPTPEAEAIAARENAGSSKTMSHLPDIVKAIALNNKINESREFAALIQAAMYGRLRKANREARSLGVKQAPFMVLIGATMPSVLAEISFLTNRQEASLLRTPRYRQAIAEALFAGISKYQKSLKATQTAAAQ